MQAWSKISRMQSEQIKKMQDELVQKLLLEVSERHPYYRSLFKELGFDAASVKGTEDLKRLPFTGKEAMLTDKADLFRPKQFVLEPPSADETKNRKSGFKLFGKKDAGADPAEYVLKGLFYTAGRTAKPVPLEYAAGDLENIKQAGLRAYDIWGVTRDDSIVNAFSYAPNVSFWQLYYGGMETGNTVLQTGGGRVLGMEKILRALDNMEANVFAAHPGYAQAALQTLAHFGFELPALERVLIGMDFAPAVQVERIKKLMSGIKAGGDRVQRIYYVSEAKSGWAECEPGFGYHTNPDHVLVEIVDPESGEPVAEGEAGEVVVTNLDARGTVVLRFRTGDIATEGITTDPCPNCGRTVPRILGDIERKSFYYEMQAEGDSVKFNANDLLRYMIVREDIALWYAELARNGNTDTLKVVVKEAGGTDKTALAATLESEIREQFGFPVTVETGSMDAILNRVGLEKSFSEKRIFDLRA